LNGLGALATADLASAPVAVQADCLRQLERTEPILVAARAAVLSAFDYNGGFKDDGQGTARTWLRWQTRITSAAASGAVGWVRRLRAHQRVAQALAAGQVSASWAREICDWTDRLPESARDEADAILLGAAAAGAGLADLAGLADQMRRQLASPDLDKPRCLQRRNGRRRRSQKASVRTASRAKTAALIPLNPAVARSPRYRREPAGGSCPNGRSRGREHRA
jgi:hypothetical protein